MKQHIFSYQSLEIQDVNIDPRYTLIINTDRAYSIPDLLLQIVLIKIYFLPSHKLLSNSECKLVDKTSGSCHNEDRIVKQYDVEVKPLHFAERAQ